jgi:hypothetical protein
VQRGLHRLRRDEIRARDERQHDVIQDQRDGDQDREFAQRAVLLFRLVGVVVRIGVLGRALGELVGFRRSTHRIRVASAVLTAALVGCHASVPGVSAECASQRFSLIFAFLPRSSRR